MKLIWLVFSLFLFQEKVPYKPNDQFRIDLDFTFKKRPPMVSSTVDFENVRKYDGSPLPYLYLNVEVLKLADEEVKIRVENSKGENIMARKIEVGAKAQLDLGFTDDIKDRVSSHEYVVYFTSKDRNPVSRIVIFFDQDGTYLVNEEKRGRL
ncbi:MAG TPA: hypothetical protein VD816_03565 [Ohtaekwangia sp.]|nr:hypothetical protein [Ohtaekwangia sp.]